MSIIDYMHCYVSSERNDNLPSKICQESTVQHYYFETNMCKLLNRLHALLRFVGMKWQPN
jgi:hypothetical protein